MKDAMKRFAAALLACLTTLALSACGAGKGAAGTAAPEQQTGTEKETVAISYPADISGIKYHATMGWAFERSVAGSPTIYQSTVEKIENGDPEMTMLMSDYIAAHDHTTLLKEVLKSGAVPENAAMTDYWLYRYGFASVEEMSAYCDPVFAMMDADPALACLKNQADAGGS